MSRRGELGRSVLLFVGLGLGWAVAARLFMRFFTDDPSFTLEGTGAIVGLVLLEFVGLGAVRGARLSGGTRWWRLAPVPGLLLFLAPGCCSCRSSSRASSSDAVADAWFGPW